MTGKEAILVAALDALQTPTPVAVNVRRSHRVPVTREQGDTVHLVDGEDRKADGGGLRCGKRRLHFTTAIFVRSDDAGAADPYSILIVERFNAASWPAGAVIGPPDRITIDTEIADEDLTKVDIEWSATYQTAGEWSLELS